MVQWFPYVTPEPPTAATPYRTAEDLPTDAEIAFWERVYAARLGQAGGDSRVSYAVEHADKALAARRARFGRR